MLGVAKGEKALLACLHRCAYTAGMAKQARLQYTIRGVPAQVDRALRAQARATGRSVNQVALEALARGAGERPLPRRDLSFISGSLSRIEAQQLEASVAKQRRIDRKLWR